MASDNDSSDLSSLSSLSPAPSDNELEAPSEIEEQPKPTATKKKKKGGGGILNYFPKASEAPAREPSPPPRKRSPSPEHEYVLADNPDIAVCYATPFAFFFCPRLLFCRHPRECATRLVASMRLGDATRRVPRPLINRILLTCISVLQFIVMFRSRFSDAFPKSLAHFGPQELERDVVQGIPGDRVEHFLCALLGLVLNRKQDVKYVTLTPVDQRYFEY